MAKRGGILQMLSRHSDLALAVAVMGVLFVLIVPVPPMLIDILLTLNIALSLLLLLVALGAVRALDFNTFPSLLLFTTLFRLSLNVASTRLILLDGFAGQMINAFGNFVVGGNMVIGLVIFLVLVVIQFVVITKGSGRISEVAARFTLDAMPGKQMAIDADLNSGLINEHEARARRERITQEAEFYGAMDGASKFVRGDAVAGLVITAINIIGGIITGTLNGMSLGEAAQTYSILTVGDGLVSQIPSLIIATTAGIIVTKASSPNHLAHDAAAQLLLRPRPLGIASGILLFFGLVPGLPTVPFLLLSGAFAGMALAAGKVQARRAAAAAPPAAGPAAPTEPQELTRFIQVDRMAVEVGRHLIPLLDPRQSDDMVRKITALRRQTATRMGFLLPAVRIHDNLQLDDDEYVIRVKGQEVGRGRLLIGHVLAMDSGLVQEKVEGIATTEPAFGLPALWVSAANKDLAEAAGYTVADPRSVLLTHLNEVVKRHAHELLSREDVRTLVDTLKEKNPTVVEELIPGVMNLGAVQRVLTGLLREGVPINDLATILETLGDTAPRTREPEALIEAVRKALARTICATVRQRGSRIGAIMLDPTAEQMIAGAVHEGGNGRAMVLQPELSERFLRRLTDAVRETVAHGYEAVLLTSSPLRRHVRRIVEQVVPDLPVLAYDETTPDAPLECRATLSLAE